MAPPLTTRRRCAAYLTETASLNPPTRPTKQRLFAEIPLEFLNSVTEERLRALTWIIRVETEENEEIVMKETRDKYKRASLPVGLWEEDILL